MASTPSKGAAFEISNPDPSIKEVTRCWASSDGRITRICDLHVNHLGNIMRMTRDSAMIIRSMKIGEMAQKKVPRTKAARTKYETVFAELVSSTWRDFTPPMFVDMERDCKRRGLKWNELTWEQEAKQTFSMDQQSAHIFIAGKHAVSLEPTMKRTRVLRTVTI